MYSFLDGFRGYNQIHMHLDDEQKTAFVTDQGIFVAVVMMFQLKTAPTMFKRIIAKIFGDFIPAFMQVFLNDFVVYGTRADHVCHLRLCLERCHGTQLSLNQAKCVFRVTSRALLIVSRDGIAVDLGKIKAIVEASALINAKSLSRCLRQISQHNRVLHYLVDFATPLHTIVHRTLFK